MKVSFPGLTSINDAVSTAYNIQIDAVDSVIGRIASETPSSGRAEVYPRLDLINGLREWIGDRVVQQLGLHTFSITNRLFEETVAVERTDLEDDQYGFLGQAAQQLGQNAGELPDLLGNQLLVNGFQTPCYDGQNFFDPAHPTFDKYGNAVTVANYFPGSAGNPPWFLFDTRKVIKPMIHQKRRPFVITPLFSLTDPNVFFQKQYVWGVDGRMNMGFGIWNLAAMSTLPLTSANYGMVRTAMMASHKPNGAPLNVRPTLGFFPSSLIATARKLILGEYDLDSTSVIASNPWRNDIEIIENTWLN